MSASFVFPSRDGAFVYYAKSDSAALFRAEKSGLNEELVYNPKVTGTFVYQTLLFFGGNDLLAVGGRVEDLPNSHLYRVNVTRHEAVDLGEVPGMWGG